MKEHTHKAIIDLLAEQEINVTDSITELYACAGVERQKKIKELERKISFAIIDDDKTLVGQIIIDLFMEFNKDAIDGKIQELSNAEKVEQDYAHGIKPPLNPAMDEAGMGHRDFYC